MGFWKDWSKFLSENAKKNMKRFSITIGSFLFLIISSIGLPFDLYIVVVYAGAVQTSGIIIMSLFGKNGNGSTHNSLETKEPIKSTSNDLMENKKTIDLTKQKIPI